MWRSLRAREIRRRGSGNHPQTNVLGTKSPRSIRNLPPTNGLCTILFVRYLCTAEYRALSSRDQHLLPFLSFRYTKNQISMFSVFSTINLSFPPIPGFLVSAVECFFFFSTPFIFFFAPGSMIREDASKQQAAFFLPFFFCSARACCRAPSSSYARPPQLPATPTTKKSLTHESSCHHPFPVVCVVSQK